MEFLLYGQKIYFNDNYILSARIFYLIHCEANKCCNKMLEIYDNLETLSELVDFGQELKQKIYNETLTSILSNVNANFPLYPINIDAFTKEHLINCGSFEVVFADIFERYIYTTGENFSTLKYQQLKRVSLSKHGNNSLGLKNAANEIVKANGVNLTVASVNSILNLADHSHINATINSELKKILNDSRNANSMFDAIYKDIIGIFDVLTDFFEKNGEFRLCYTNEDFNKAALLLKEIDDNNFSKEKLREHILKLIYLSPLDPKNYAVSYYLLGDETHELESLADTFGVDIDFNNYKAAEKNAQLFFGEDFQLIENQLNNNLFYKQTRDLLGNDLLTLLGQCKYLFNSKLQALILSSSEDSELNRFTSHLNLFGCFNSIEEIPLIIFDNSTPQQPDGFIITNSSIYFCVGPIIDLANIINTKLTSTHFIINDYEIPMLLNALDAEDLKELNDFVDYLLILYKYYQKNHNMDLKYNIICKLDRNFLLSSNNQEDIVLYAKTVVNNFCDEDVKNSIFSFSQEPPINKKFKNAIETYVILEKDEFPLICYDNTAFGSAKDGCIITNKRIHVHNSSQKPRTFLYGEISNIMVNRTPHMELYINEYEVLTTLLTTNESKIRFCSMLNKLRKDFNKTPYNRSLQSIINEKIINNLIEQISKILTSINITSDIQKNLFVYSQNPRVLKKFENSRNTYASLEDGELPILCYDDTVFGSARDGCLVTSRYIHIHNSFTKSQKFQYKEITNISMKGDATKNLYINNYELQTTMLVSNESKIMFCTILNHILESIKA